MDHPFLELLSGDKRKVKRVNLRKPVKTTLNIMGQKIVVELYNYSHHGMGLIVPGEKGIQLVESQLVFPEMTFEGQLVHQQITHSKGIQVGFALPQNQGQKYLFRFDDPDWDIIKDEKTIENIYDDVVFKGYECPFEIYQHNNVMSFFPL